MTTRRPSGLFRGSELPRLLLLAAVLMVGWPMILLSARPAAEPEPPPKPAVVADDLPRVAPDTGLEFEALVDKTGMSTRDNPAYAILLRRARETKPADLARAARRDLYFTHLWERPERYRGVPVHLEGTVVKTLAYEINPALAPGGRLVEAWFYSDENKKYPYCLIIEQPPRGFPIAPDLYLRATFDGYFMKLLRYDAGDVPRAAPMLVGRLQATPAPVASSPLADVRRFTRRDGFLVVVGLLSVYVLVRVLLGLRKALRPTRPVVVRDRPLSEGEIAPEALGEWLASLPDEEDEDGAMGGKPRP